MVICGYIHVVQPVSMYFILSKDSFNPLDTSCSPVMFVVISTQLEYKCKWWYILDSTIQLKVVTFPNQFDAQVLTGDGNSSGSSGRAKENTYSFVWKWCLKNSFVWKFLWRTELCQNNQTFTALYENAAWRTKPCLKNRMLSEDNIFMFSNIFGTSKHLVREKQTNEEK